MSKHPQASNNVIDFNSRHPYRALERLNRLTGLNFTEIPESLIGNKSHMNAVSISGQKLRSMNA